MDHDLDRLRWEAKANLATALLAQRMVEIEALLKAQAHAEALDARLQEIFASASWRLTAPLRLQSFLRRASGKTRP
jgi:hypothetical protein